ncbi:hypothetical protein K1719_007444 [Acacia pycnantha]|nr:hypothetical protein K1719_007444 [Acacia pycnantha]
MIPNDSSMPSVSKDNTTTSSKNESLWSSKNDVNTMDKNSSITVVPPLFNTTSSLKNENHKPSQNDNNVEDKNSGVPFPNKGSSSPEVLPISEMNTLLLQSHASYPSMMPRWSSAVDQELLQVRSEIENAPIIKNDPSPFTHAGNEVRSPHHENPSSISSDPIAEGDNLYDNTYHGSPQSSYNSPTTDVPHNHHMPESNTSEEVG